MRRGEEGKNEKRERMRRGEEGKDEWRRNMITREGRVGGWEGGRKD